MVVYARYKFNDRCIVAQQTLARKQDILYNYHGRNMTELCKADNLGLFGISGLLSMSNQYIAGAFMPFPIFSNLIACIKTLR
jgi:hypothetical protein